MYVTTDLVGMIMAGIGLFVIGFVAGIMASVGFTIYRHNRKKVDDQVRGLRLSKPLSFYILKFAKISSSFMKRINGILRIGYYASVHRERSKENRVCCNPLHTFGTGIGQGGDFTGTDIFEFAKKSKTLMKELISMKKLNKGTISFLLMMLASGITMAANWFEVRDAIDDCKETYKDALRELIAEEREELTKAS